MSKTVENPILEVKNVTKIFPGTVALDDVSISFEAGKIHAIVGENGAGKSTLINVIGGVLEPNDGEVWVNGNRVRIPNPYVAQKLGIGCVHQEIALCQHLSITENIFAGVINEQNTPLVNFKKYHKDAIELLGLFDLKISPKRRVSSLSISEQQIVEIAKALSYNSRVIIFDEPTAAITENESILLFKVIHNLKKKGIAIIYISHRMAEIFEHCDTVSILRDGKLIKTTSLEGETEDSIVTSMVGRELSEFYPAKAEKVDTYHDLLNVENLSSGTDFQNITFQLRKGEILGFAGLIGAGRSELAKAICGLQPKTSGKIFLEGKELSIKHYQNAIDNGIVYLTEDRKAEGLYLKMDIKTNISAMNIRKISNGYFLNKVKEQSLAQEYIKSLNIRCSGCRQRIRNLSGGNQQKVLIAKLLSTNPKVIFMDEPTRGIDVGAKSEIHNLLRSIANKGTGVIVITSELPEAIGLCDRVLVMHEGSFCGIVEGKDINEEEIIRRASGV